MRQKQMQCHSSCMWKQAALWKDLLKPAFPRLCLMSEWWNPQVLLLSIRWEMCELCSSIPHTLAALPMSSGLLPSQPNPPAWLVTWAGDRCDDQARAQYWLLTDWPVDCCWPPATMHAASKRLAGAKNVLCGPAGTVQRFQRLLEIDW